MQAGGATEPLKVVGAVGFEVITVYGSGLLLARARINRPDGPESLVGRRILPLAPCIGRIVITTGMQYAYANTGDGQLVVVDVSRPVFKSEYEQASEDPHVLGRLHYLGHG